VGTSKLFLLPAMILTYVLCGTLDFNLTDIAKGIFPPSANPVMVQITYALFVMGLAKAAMMPFHNWLPSAMVAPTPVSALLHAVAVVKAGVFSVSRILLSVFGVEAMSKLGLGMATAYVAALTIILASFIALTKDDLKARLAYSTVSQLSYVILGVSLLSPLSITGGISHIAYHAFSKITLFFGAGAIYVATHQKKISALGGMGRRMPWTFGAFSVASLSMIGIPPLCGFVSKWYMINGAVSMGYYIFVCTFLASTILNAAYFMPIIYKAFFDMPAPGIDLDHYSEAPSSMVIPLCITAAISVFLGIYPDVIMQFVNIFMTVK